MNIRLDFIDKFVDEDMAIMEMSGVRHEFMKLDEKIKSEYAHAADKPAMQRSLANARSRIEDALHHMIKALCLKHEKLD